MSEFSTALLLWYDRHRRTFPWRGTTDPYRIWLSEIMLQQTRTETVERYYARFLERFPTVRHLAGAKEDEVLKLWEGLGYYSRARNLHSAAKKVAFELNSCFPGNAVGLRALPGVGPYAANAIASIAYGEPVPALDGNQARVLARIEACDIPLKTPFDLESQAFALLDRDRPGDYNQAMMDLGAAVCTPKSPRCDGCPVQAYCLALREGDPESFPRKRPPVAKQEIDLTIAVAQCGSGIAVRRRPSKGLLGGLYEFPSLDGRLSAGALPAALEQLGFTGVRLVCELPPAKHVFTHLIWRMTGFHVEVASVPPGWVVEENLSSIAFPSALRVYREIAGTLIPDAD